MKILVIFVTILFGISCGQSSTTDGSSPVKSTTRAPDVEDPENNDEEIKCPIAWQSSEKTSLINNINAKDIKDKIEQVARALPVTNSTEKEKKKLALQTAIFSHKYPPKLGYEIQAKKFYISQIFCGDRPMALLYVQDRVDWLARLFYRSKSNGVWRSTRYLSRGVFDKGAHYTQDMLPHNELDALLNSEKMGACLAKDAKELDQIKASFDEANQKEAANFKPQIVSPSFNKDFSNYDIGRGLKDGDLKTREDFFLSMTKDKMPPGFSPDFSCLNKTYFRSHSIFSKISGSKKLKNNIKVDVFLAKLNDKVIEWHFAYVEETKEPWLARIRLADAPVSSFGTDKIIIDSGALTLKPIEYTSQIKNLIKGQDYDEKIISGTYVDIRKFLQNFPPIIEYKKYKEKSASW